LDNTRKKTPDITASDAKRIQIQEKLQDKLKLFKNKVERPERIEHIIYNPDLTEDKKKLKFNHHEGEDENETNVDNIDINNNKTKINMKIKKHLFTAIKTKTKPNGTIINSNNKKNQNSPDKDKAIQDEFKISFVRKIGKGKFDNTLKVLNKDIDYDDYVRNYGRKKKMVTYENNFTLEKTIPKLYEVSEINLFIGKEIKEPEIPEIAEISKVTEEKEVINVKSRIRGSLFNMMVEALYKDELDIEYQYNYMSNDENVEEENNEDDQEDDQEDYNFF